MFDAICWILLLKYRTVWWESRNLGAFTKKNRHFKWTISLNLIFTMLMLRSFGLCLKKCITHHSGWRPRGIVTHFVRQSPKDRSITTVCWHRYLSQLRNINKWWFLENFVTTLVFQIELNKFLCTLIDKGRRYSSGLKSSPFLVLMAIIWKWGPIC